MTDRAAKLGIFLHEFRAVLDKAEPDSTTNAHLDAWESLRAALEGYDDSAIVILSIDADLERANWIREAAFTLAQSVVLPLQSIDAIGASYVTIATAIYDGAHGDTR